MFLHVWVPGSPSHQGQYTRVAGSPRKWQWYLIDITDLSVIPPEIVGEDMRRSATMPEKKLNKLANTISRRIALPAFLTILLFVIAIFLSSCHSLNKAC